VEGLAEYGTGPPALKVGRLQREINLPKARIRLVEYAGQSFDVRGTLETFRLELALGRGKGKNTGSVRCPENRDARNFEACSDLYLLLPGRCMHSQGSTNIRQSIVFEFAPDAFGDWFDQSTDWASNVMGAGLDIDNPVIRATLRRLATEIIDPGFGHELLCELLAAQIALDLARHCGATSESRQSGGLSPHRLRAIEDRLSEIAPPPTLDELAGLSGLSVRQLTRGFRASKYCSIGDYLAEKRISNAKDLLGSDVCIKEIAHRLGFASAGNFSTAFRKATGRSPRDFRIALTMGIHHAMPS